MAFSDPVSLILGSWDSHSSPSALCSASGNAARRRSRDAPCTRSSPVEAFSYVGVGIVKIELSKEQMRGSRVLDPNLGSVALLSFGVASAFDSVMGRRAA
jgi:hypothetical protein